MVGVATTPTSAPIRAHASYTAFTMIVSTKVVDGDISRGGGLYQISASRVAEQQEQVKEYEYVKLMRRKG